MPFAKARACSNCCCTTALPWEAAGKQAEVRQPCPRRYQSTLHQYIKTTIKNKQKKRLKNILPLLYFPDILHHPVTALTHSLCCLFLLVKRFALSLNSPSQGKSQHSQLPAKSMFALSVHFSNLLWYLNINCHFHLSCITCSSKGQIMPPVTPIPLHRVHIPPSKW